jgi:FKBP-type peptidyl-prolyl cis-trans isomerase
MKVGGMQRLIIPSEMAYGSAQAASNIPPGSDLVLDIELAAIQ